MEILCRKLCLLIGLAFVCILLAKINILLLKLLFVIGPGRYQAAKKTKGKAPAGPLKCLNFVDLKELEPCLWGSYV